MIDNAIFWLSLNLLSVVILGFYSMLEMACVSFNRVRLHYYVSKGDRNAILLNELLHNPSRLFGTTLIMVNVAMFFGSECSREFHIAIGVNPDLAPLTQVVLVVILGELAPMFAARSYSENVALLGVPIIYASSRLMTPILWILEAINKLCSKIISSKDHGSAYFLTQEELQKILEEQEKDQLYATDSEQFNAITSNIFSLRNKEVGQAMTPLSKIPIIPSSITTLLTKEIFKATGADYLPIYHNNKNNIIAIAFPRDLLRASDKDKTRQFARIPWFVTQSTKLPQILQQFRSNTQEVAIILNPQGKATGIINRDEIIDEIFGKIEDSPKKIRQHVAIINRTLPGSMLVGEFNDQFNVVLDEERDLTLGKLIERELGYRPEENEAIYIGHFELTVKETTLLGIKTIGITTKIE